MRRIALLLSLLASLCWPLHAETNTTPYIKLEQAKASQTPQLTLFFWYGCDACRQLLEPVESLQQQFPQLQLKLVPAQLRNNWYWAAKAYYCAQQLPNPEQLHQALFTDADWQQLTSHQQLVDWFVQHGAPQQQVESLIYSPLINQQLDRDRSTYPQPLQGVPSAIINNQFMVDASMVDSATQMLEVISNLLQRSMLNQKEAALLDALTEETLIPVSDS